MLWKKNYNGFRIILGNLCIVYMGFLLKLFKWTYNSGYIK
ncbi:putative membrane protein [Clostridioides difficile DA00165]|nr:putative membrane protein [Clostridioides difficile DA00165]